MRSFTTPRLASIGLLLCLASALAGCPAPGGGEDAGAGDAGMRGDGGMSDRDAGTCVTNADCVDDLYCTDRERCVEGRCTFQPTLCDDGIDCTTDTCSEERRRCENVGPDVDGDGSRDADCYDYRGVPLGDDCDDDDAMRFPSNLEVCDAMGHDEDCDLTTFGGVDADGDEYESSACCQRDAMDRLRCGTDCDDAVGSTHPLAGEICNGLDDDCDELDDDIIHGSVICAHEDARPCTTSCGLAGTETCNAACLGWDTCVADEVCNGCDDDNDAAQDEDFECALGTSRACMTSCGTSGTQLCGDTCSYTACAGTERCNYCDDDGDGNFSEERALATFTATDSWRTCTPAGGARCIDVFLTGTVAELLDGTANDQSGAIWLDAGTLMGWGPVELEVTMEVSGRSLGGADEVPLGGWALVLGRGTTGAGTPENMGIPTTVTGVAARWFWTQFDTCTFPATPIGGDAIRATQIVADGTLVGLVTPEDAIPGMILPEISCRVGYPLSPGSSTFDAPAQTLTQRMRLRYQPDDPTTAADEESMTITATAGAVTTNQVVPSDAIPVGTGPVRVGITAGAYTDPLGGFVDVGMPVRARVVVHRFDAGCPECGIDDYPISVTYGGSCPR
jgi:hypothetical protein